MQLLARTLKTARGSVIGLRYGMASGGATPSGTRRVTLDIRRFQYSRYFYSFVKFLTMEGVAVDLRFRPETLHALSRAQYGNMVLSERLVRLGGGEPGDRVIGDLAGDAGFGPFDFLPSRDPAVYDVPMAQHPLMYARGLWNQPVDSGAPRPAVLFIGNSEPGTYSKIDSDGVFDVIGRVRLWDILRRSGLSREPAAGADLANVADGTVTLVDSSAHSIPMERFRQTVAGFGFFLCAPGVFMPLCHNLVEAMSVGAIPLIQRSYAELLEPVLEHGRNAIVFDGEADLVAKVGEALAMDPARIAGMKQAVLAYHEDHLSPRAVVSRVLHPEVRTIRMLAGERSVALLRERRGSGKA
jgi:hypothetical protein